MDAIDQLKAQAAAKRDAAILKANQDYRHDMREIRAVARLFKPIKKLSLGPKNPRPAKTDTTFRNLTTIQAAEAVLGEGKPLRLVELVIEIQSRGCRSSDDPRAVLRAIRASFTYHKGKFTQDAEGRWGVVAGC